MQQIAFRIWCKATDINVVVGSLDVGTPGVRDSKLGCRRGSGKYKQLLVAAEQQSLGGVQVAAEEGFLGFQAQHQIRAQPGGSRLAVPNQGKG